MDVTRTAARHSERKTDTTHAATTVRGCFCASDDSMAKKVVKRETRKATSGNGKPGVVVKALELRRNYPSGQLPIFANNLAVQNDDSTFQLFFFEARPPLLLEEGE